MADRNEFRFDGKLYEKVGGTDRTVLNRDNIVAADDNIVITKPANSDNVAVGFGLPISIVNGALCVTFQKETEEE